MHPRPISDWPEHATNNQHSLPLLLCPECGAVTPDPAVHKAWHEKVEREVRSFDHPYA